MSVNSIKNYLMFLFSNKKEEIQNSIREAKEQEEFFLAATERANNALYRYEDNISTLSKEMSMLFEKLYHLNDSLVLLDSKLVEIKATLEKNNDKILELQLLTMNKDKVGKA